MRNRKKRAAGLTVFFKARYKLAREGEKDKEKDEDFEKVKDYYFIFFQVVK